MAQFLGANCLPLLRRPPYRLLVIIRGKSGHQRVA